MSGSLEPIMRMIPMDKKMSRLIEALKSVNSEVLPR